jgi:hypothetical protein
MKKCAPTNLLKSNTNAATPVADRGVLLVFLAHEVSRSRNSNAINPLNTINSVVSLLGLHFLRLRVCALLATLFEASALVVPSSFSFLRSRFALLGRRRLVYATRRGASARGRRRDLRALERVPASA